MTAPRMTCPLLEQSAAGPLPTNNKGSKHQYLVQYALMLTENLTRASANRVVYFCIEAPKCWHCTWFPLILTKILHDTLKHGFAITQVALRMKSVSPLLKASSSLASMSEQFLEEHHI